MASEFNASITVGMIAITRLSTAATSQVVQPRFEPPETTNWSIFTRPPASLAMNSCIASIARTPLLTMASLTSQKSSFVSICLTRL